MTHVLDVPMYSDSQLRAACAKATADERERCARLAKLHGHPRMWAAGMTGDNALRQFADLIRQQP
jgi:hypothetical protein